MIITKNVDVKIVSRNIKHFKKLGYDVNIYDIISVPVSQLTKGCHLEIEVQCDYCKKTVIKTYKQLMNERKKSITKKDCCIDCIYDKGKESNLSLYGVENQLQRESIKKKIKKTLIKRYGVDNPTKNKSIAKKISESWQNKTDSQKREIRKKQKKTCKEKFGIECTFNTVKSRQNLFKTQNKASVPQKETFKILKKEYGSSINLGVPYSKLCLDMLLIVKDTKIDIEYDSSYWHEPNTDRKRDEFLKLNGFKILRIKSGKNIPKKKDLLDKINFLLDSGYSYSEIVLEDWDEEQYNERRG